MSKHIVGPDLLAVLRPLRLGKLVETLPERLALAEAQSMTHQDFLLMVLSQEVSRCNSCAIQNRIQEARLEPRITLGQFDATSENTYNKRLC